MDKQALLGFTDFVFFQTSGTVEIKRDNTANQIIRCRIFISLDFFSSFQEYTLGQYVKWSEALDVIRVHSCTAGLARWRRTMSYTYTIVQSAMSTIYAKSVWMHILC